MLKKIFKIKSKSKIVKLNDFKIDVLKEIQQEFASQIKDLMFHNFKEIFSTDVCLTFLIMADEYLKDIAGSEISHSELVEVLNVTFLALFQNRMFDISNGKITSDMFNWEKLPQDFPWIFSVGFDPDTGASTRTTLIKPLISDTQYWLQCSFKYSLKKEFFYKKNVLNKIAKGNC